MSNNSIIASRLSRNSQGNSFDDSWVNTHGPVFGTSTRATRNSRLTGAEVLRQDSDFYYLTPPRNTELDLQHIGSWPNPLPTILEPLSGNLDNDLQSSASLTDIPLKARRQGILARSSGILANSDEESRASATSQREPNSQSGDQMAPSPKPGLHYNTLSAPTLLPSLILSNGTSLWAFRHLTFEQFTAKLSLRGISPGSISAAAGSAQQEGKPSGELSASSSKNKVRDGRIAKQSRRFIFNQKGRKILTMTEAVTLARMATKTTVSQSCGSAALSVSEILTDTYTSLVKEAKCAPIPMGSSTST